MDKIEKAWKIIESDINIIGLPVGTDRHILEALLDLNNRLKKLEGDKQ